MIRSSSRPDGREGEEGGFGSYLRRSSAPEIDHESPAEEEEREARRRREVSYTRSLERGRLGRGEVIFIVYFHSFVQVSTYSSDCEDHATKLPDKKELQVPDPHLLIAIRSFYKYDYVNISNSIDGNFLHLTVIPGQ